MPQNAILDAPGGAGPFRATIAGGQSNTIRTNSNTAFIGGGLGNIIGNDCRSATLAGGRNNVIHDGGYYATIPGGRSCEAASLSFATGHCAKALTHGCTVFTDATDADFATTADNQFLIRAVGGVGIGIRYFSGVGIACQLAFLALFSEGNGFAARSEVYVDWRYPDTDSDGSLARSFFTVEQGHAQVATSGTIRIRQGRYLVGIPLDKPLLLEPCDGPVRLGGSVGNGFRPDNISPPETPRNLRATEVANMGIRLDWEDRSDNETGFYLSWEGTGSSVPMIHKFYRAITP